MDNVKGVLALLVLALGAASFLLLVQNSAMRTQAGDARALATVTRDLLRAQEVRCSASDEEFREMASCIVPLLAQDDFERDAFRDYDERRDDSGYLVMRNDARKTYMSEEFTFYFNRELIQTGCTVPGEISHGVTCRADFNRECRDGDIIEAYYPVDEEPVRVFLMTC